MAPADLVSWELSSLQCCLFLVTSRGRSIKLGLCMCAKSLHSCLTFCDPMDCRPPGSSVHGILQSRILEWVAMPFSTARSLGLFIRASVEILRTSPPMFQTSHKDSHLLIPLSQGLRFQHMNFMRCKNSDHNIG